MEVLSSDKETRSVRFGCLLLTSVFAFILIVTVLPNLGSADTTDTPWVIVCGILFAYLIYSHARTYMRLVDAVFDCGDFLRIRKG
ncbi:MAG: hypothetical protein LBS49_08740, partial [Candidatus Accumulibacter sp.]|nr:hypothetical protein [Accumulibacter sp.]